MHVSLTKCLRQFAQVPRQSNGLLVYRLQKELTKLSHGNIYFMLIYESLLKKV